MKSPLSPKRPSLLVGAMLTLASLSLAATASAQLDAPLDEEPEAEETTPSEPEPSAPSDVALDEETTDESAQGSADVGTSLDATLVAPTPENEEESAEVEESTVPDKRGDLPYIPFEGVTPGKDQYFGWDLGVEMDVGFADYRFSAESLNPETFHDARGQIWLAPVYEHRFGKNGDVFLRGSAEFVAWLREQANQYQVNVFDAYAQVGVKDIVDLKVGRVTTWRVYQPGAGFDIYTLEDTGCLTAPPIEGQAFCTSRYEVNHIWLRGTPYRAALHLYPLKKILPKEWSDLGIEATVEYGKDNNTNILGQRAAIVYDNQWARLAAGAERRWGERAMRNRETDGEICDKCTEEVKKGFGVSAVVRPPFLEGGVNYAATENEKYTLAPPGEIEAGDQWKKDSRGGFVELHTGHLLASTKKGPRPAWHADQRDENIRQITVGFGQHRTYNEIENGDFEVHIQRAIYLKYNLGFNMSYLKLVASKSESSQYNLISAEGAAAEYSLRESDMLAIRLRFAYFF